MIFLVDVRFLIYYPTTTTLEDTTRYYIVTAQNRNECEDKIDRLIKSYNLPSNEGIYNRNIGQILRIRQALLDDNGIGEIT